MKKTLLSIALVATGLVAFAQKPAAGDKTAEAVLNFQTGTAPVSYGLNSSLGIPELRLRYFLNEGMAVRVKLGLGSSSTTTKVSDGATSNPVIAEVKTSSGFGLSIAPGIEKHFAGTDKLSPYAGAELPIVFASGGTTEVTNSTSGAPTPADVVKDDKFKSEGGSQFRLGLNLVLGADYYITDGVYLGGEMGLGIFSMTSTGDSKTTVTPAGGTAVEATAPGGSAFSLFGAYATTGVRLGFKF